MIATSVNAGVRRNERIAKRRSPMKPFMNPPAGLPGAVAARRAGSIAVSVRASADQSGTSASAAAMRHRRETRRAAFALVDRLELDRELLDDLDLAFGRAVSAGSCDRT